MLSCEQLEDPQGLQGAEGFLPERKRERGLDLWPLKGFTVSLVHDISSPGERGSGVGASWHQVPADMIRVQVGEEHRIDIFGTDACGLQLRHQTAIHPASEHI